MRSIAIVALLLVWSSTILAAPNDKIGPSISEELQAAGVAGLPFAWNPQTGQVRTDDPRLTEAQRTTILSVFSAHDPTKLSSTSRDEKAKTDATRELVSHCLIIEADTTSPVSLKTLCRLFRQILIH